MLKRINAEKHSGSESVKIKDAYFPVPFKSGLEYGAPARGSWNIVHTGMLIPEAHEIFVCAKGCLRGVVLTAAEMGAAHRFSTIEIKENNLLDGTMEDLIIDGVSEIVTHLDKKPPAILLYTSCIHHFTGCDMDMVFDTLRQKLPDIDFTDCYMNPIMRKSGLTPDQLMRRQLYSLLKPVLLNEKSINIIGNDLPTDETSELCKIIRSAGFSLKDITHCTTYEEYQKMAESFVNISYYPAATESGDTLFKRLGQKHLYLPVSFDFEEIKAHIDALTNLLNIQPFNHEARIADVSKRLTTLKSILRDTKVTIDYVAVSRPFELAKLLVSYGINVTAIYADSVTQGDKSAFMWLKDNAPDISIFATVHPKMRVINRETQEKIVAIGQKAAYFTGTQNFVNIVEGGGHWGYDGIIRLCDEIEEAFYNEKDTKCLIQIKGMGCGCC